MIFIAVHKTPVPLVIHEPSDEEGRRLLSRHAADAHADMICNYIRQLSCSSKQKETLFSALLQKNG